jgi:hypothetical protein
MEVIVNCSAIFAAGSSHVGQTILIICIIYANVVPLGISFTSNIGVAVQRATGVKYLLIIKQP